jgi:UDP-3-O-[3-hydroxymyristoyl] glucosamine N-acyltransferase
MEYLTKKLPKLVVAMPSSERTMPDPRFFTVAGPFTLEHLAAVTSAELALGVDPSLLIRDVAALDHAGPTEISFLDNRKYVDAFSTSKAGACFVHRCC